MPSWAGKGPLLLCLSGPTGVGKTAAAIELYQRYGWPIISADSRQVYRYLDIGTNKLPQAVLAEVPHGMIDVCYPSEVFSAGRFVAEAQRYLRLWAQLPVVQVVGGTGFYIQALVYGLAAIPPVSSEVREAVRRWYAAEGLAALVAWLKVEDPLTAARIDLRNPRRVLRAIEVYKATGRPWASYWEGASQRQLQAVIIALQRDSPSLRQAIRQRTRRQVAAGWLEETEFVLSRGYPPSAPGLQTLGYKECLACLEGRLPKAELAERIAAANWAYARRQLTWWRGHPPDFWIMADTLSAQLAQIEACLKPYLG
ncbi:MAG: tRNA (adenosine(37)-N6)-dimethylallyltransferase MiaA [Bacteroidia bacterium]|nr:tRNA (adenosine(37)-N6)-dimethylallyltransferase MiaA [Bacteroidia bacterium]MDW8089648.1 tRNA (adenosine(37)-N6)-dimethylallyltransferase MiaA [Bacteroidia bacterium]